MKPTISPVVVSTRRNRIMIIIIIFLVLVGIATGIYLKFFYKRAPTDQELRQQYTTEVQAQLRETVGRYLSESPVAPISPEGVKKMNAAIKVSASSTAPISEEGKLRLDAAIADVITSQEQAYQDWKKAHLEKK